MAGSLNHIVDNETGEFTTDTIDYGGDAIEALRECYNVIRELTDGDKDQINEVLDKLGYPRINQDLNIHTQRRAE